MECADRMPEQASIRDLLELGDFDGYLQSKPERRERRRDRVVDLALQLARIVQERKRG